MISCGDDECINNICNCPEGYEGSNCNEQTTPRAIKILNIELKKFPATRPDGSPWDAVNMPEPDLYIKIYNDNKVSYIHEELLSDASNEEVHNFAPPYEVLLENPIATCSIELWDFNPNYSHEEMGEIEFIAYTSDNSFPSKIIVGTGSEIEFELSVSYKF